MFKLVRIVFAIAVAVALLPTFVHAEIVNLALVMENTTNNPNPDTNFFTFTGSQPYYDASVSNPTSKSLVAAYTGITVNSGYDYATNGPITLTLDLIGQVTDGSANDGKSNALSEVHGGFYQFQSNPGVAGAVNGAYVKFSDTQYKPFSISSIQNDTLSSTTGNLYGSTGPVDVSGWGFFAGSNTTLQGKNTNYYGTYKPAGSGSGNRYILLAKANYTLTGDGALVSSGGSTNLYFVPQNSAGDATSLPSPSTFGGSAISWMVNATSFGFNNTGVWEVANPTSGTTRYLSSTGYTLNLNPFVIKGTGSVSSGYAGRADITSGPTAANTFVLPGGTVNINGVLTNSTTQGTGTQDSVTYTVGATVTSGSISPASFTGGPLAPTTGTASLSATYTAPTGVFGLVNVTYTPSGTGTNGPAGTTGPKSTTVSVVGQTAVGTGLAFGTAITSMPVGAGTFSNLETTIGTITGGAIGNTAATILQGTSNGAQTFTMKYRSRTAQETPATFVKGSGAFGVSSTLPVYSDVVDLTTNGSMATAASNAYVMQVTYAPGELGGQAAAADTFSRGYLYLGYAPGTGSAWVNAIAGNDTTGADQGGIQVQQYNGSWATFMAGPGSGHSLQQLLGSWGVDTQNNTAWAVVDHYSQFAVVPEPGTIGLLAAGALALGIAYRRRKAAKA